MTEQSNVERLADEWGDGRAPTAAAELRAAIEADRAAGVAPEQLRRWKAEALSVLAGWELVWDALGRPGTLGEVKWATSLAEARRLRSKCESAEAFGQRVVMDSATAEAKLARVRRALDDELQNLADDGARLSHSVVRRIEAALAHDPVE